MTENKKINAIIFDLGGVVININFHRVCRYWAQAAGCAPEKIIGRFVFDTYYEQHERGEISAAEYFEALRRTLQIDLSDTQFLKGWNAVFVGEMPNIRPLLQRLSREVPLYVFSNSNEAHKRYWMKQYADVLRPFREIFVSSDIGKRKPDQDAFLHVAEAIGSPSGELLFIDDSLQNVKGAGQVGIHAAHVESLQDIVTVLKRYSLQ